MGGTAHGLYHENPAKLVDFPSISRNHIILMTSQKSTGLDLVKNSVLYKEFLAEREEILRHKWIESEKAGHDIGFEKALLDWIVMYRSNWRSQRIRNPQANGGQDGAQNS